MSAVSRLPLVGWLFPAHDEPGATIARRAQLLLTVALSLANLVGATVVFVFLGLVLPTPGVADPTRTLIVNLIATAIYVGIGVGVGAVWGARRLRPLQEWLRSDHPATEEERDLVLRAPYRIAGIHAFMWGGAAIFFGALNWTYSSELGQRVAMTVALGGITTCAVAYLVTERGLRPAAARALAEGVSERTVTPGVKARALLAWILGTGIPLLGLIITALSTLIEGDFNADQLAVTMLGLAGIALVIGFYVSTLAARAVADPVKEVREALSEVEGGNLD